MGHRCLPSDSHEQGRGPRLTWSTRRPSTDARDSGKALPGGRAGCGGARSDKSAGHSRPAYRAAVGLDAAIPLYERALADNERILGHDHPSTLAVGGNLAAAREAARRPSRKSVPECGS